MRFKIISFLSSGGYYVWQASTVWAILIEGLTRKMCVKLFDIRATSLGDVFSLFLLALDGILFCSAKSFRHFW